MILTYKIISDVEDPRFDKQFFFRRNGLRRAGGALAQLGEHHVRNVGVEGSNPLCSTGPMCVWCRKNCVKSGLGEHHVVTLF